MTAPAPNPYVGLRPFEAADASLFFGRRQQTRELLDRLSGGRFVAVVGGSGCGKSSLVRAGLIPRLKAGFLVKDRDEWQVVVMKPGASPLPRLAASLVARDNGEVDAFTASLADEGVDALVRHVKLGLGDRRSLLVVVDQFEEVFGSPGAADHVAAYEQAAVFISVLLDLAQASELPAFVAITMRSDFIEDCGRFPALADALNRGLYVVPALTREHRRESILGPARRAGGSLNAALVDHLLNRCGRDADDLPVLQHVLMRTWQRWKESGNESADLGNFESAGGFERAIHNHAEKTLRAAVSAANGDGEDRRALIERLFQALTEIDPANRAIRRRAAMSTLVEVAGGSREEVRQSLEPFREQSFLVWGEEEDPVVDLSHESLIGRWKTLSCWVEEEARSAAEYRRLLEAAVLHRHRVDGVRQGGLRQDPELATALRWRDRCRPNAAWARRVRPPEILQAQAGRNGPGSSMDAVARRAFPLAMAFLNRSRRERDAEAQRQALGLAKAQRQRRFRIRLGWAIGLMLPAIGFFALDWHQATQRVKAFEEASEALSQSMVSTTRLGTSPWTSLFLAADALRSTRGLQERAALVGQTDLLSVQSHAETALRRVLARVSGSKIVAVHGKPLVALVPGPDGRTFLSTDASGAVRQGLIQPRRPQAVDEMGLLFQPSNPGVGRTHVGTGGGWLAIGTGRTLRVRRLDGSSAAFTLDTGNGISALAVDPKGSCIVIGTVDGRVRSFDLASQRFDNTISVGVGKAPVARVRISRDGQWVAVAYESGQWGLWEIKPGGSTAVGQPRTSLVSGLDFDLANQRLLIATLDGLAALNLRWGAPVLLSPLAPHGSERIDDMLASPDGRWLALRTTDGLLRLVSSSFLGTGSSLTSVRPFGSREPDQSFAFTPDSRSLLLGGREGIVARWELPASAAQPSTPGANLAGEISAVALSPDLTWQAIGTLEGQVRAWVVDPPGSLPRSALTHGSPPPTSSGSPGLDGIVAVRMSSDGHWLASLTRANALTLWKVSGRGVLTSWVTERDVAQVEFSGDGRRLVVGTGRGGDPARSGGFGDASLRELSPAGTGPTISLGRLERVALSRSGRYMLGSRPGGGIELWRLDAPLPPRPVSSVAQGTSVSALTMSPGDRWGVAGTLAGEIHLWALDAGTGGGGETSVEIAHARATSPSGGRRPITAVAVDRDEKRLFAADAEGTVRVYTLPLRSDGLPDASFAAHDGAVQAMTLSPAGLHLLTRGEDATTRLWRIDPGDERDAREHLHAYPMPQLIEDPSGPLAESAFSQDGRYLLTVTVTGSSRWWSVDPEELLREAHAVAGRNLNQDEWDQFLPAGVPFRRIFAERP